MGHRDTETRREVSSPWLCSRSGKFRAKKKAFLPFGKKARSIRPWAALGDLLGVGDEPESRRCAGRRRKRRRLRPQRALDLPVEGHLQRHVGGRIAPGVE